MSEVQQKCLEIANLLTNNIRSRLDPNLRLNLDELVVNDKSTGLIQVLQLMESLDDSDEYVLVNSQELYYKLVELADTLIFSDIGELSSIQNSLYKKIRQVCDKLDPDCREEEEIPVCKLTGSCLSSMLMYLKEDHYYDDDDCDTEPDQDPILTDPLYEKIAQVLNISVTGKISKKELSDKIDDVIDSFKVKSPVRSKTAFVYRLNEVNDAVNLISKTENVFFTDYLKFQVHEIYTLLKHDDFYPKNCLLVESKLVFLTFIHKCKASLNVMEKFFKKEKQSNVCCKIYHWICELLNNIVECLSSRCEKVLNDNCILITLLNMLIFMSILT